MTNINYTQETLKKRIRWKNNKLYYILKSSTFWGNYVVFHSDEYCCNYKSELYNKTSELAEYYEDIDISDTKGIFYSKKFDRDISYTTKQQEKFIHLAESKNDIISLVEKPVLIPYDGDLAQVFSPDFLFFDQKGLGRMIILVSYRKFATQEIQKRILALKKYCTQKGLGYIVFDIEKIISFKWMSEQVRNKDGWNNLFEDAISTALSKKQSHWLNEFEINNLCSQTHGNLIQLQLFSMIHKWLYAAETPTRKIILLGSDKEGLVDSSEIIGSGYIKNWRKKEKQSTYTEPTDSSDIVCEEISRKEIVKTYFDNIMLVRHNGLYGIDGRYNKSIIPCLFDNIDMAFEVGDENVCRIIFLAKSSKNILLISYDGENIKTEKQFSLV